MKYARRNSEGPGPLRTAGIADLAIGQPLYLSDPRRTPAVVIAHHPQTAGFTVRICDFEDAGAEWEFPGWEASRFLVAIDAPQLGTKQIKTLSAEVERLNQSVHIDGGPRKRNEADAEIAATEGEVSAWLDRHGVHLSRDRQTLLSRRTPDEGWSAALMALMADRGLSEIDRTFARCFASNPHAGEMIKGHRMVLAEMGLCPYDGPVLRDPTTFSRHGTRNLRRSHLVTRLAFMRIMLRCLGLSTFPLFRTIYASATLEAPRNRGFVSTTFSRDVARALFESGPPDGSAALYRQRIGMERVFMTYLETPALSEKYKEAEAILLFDPGNPVF